MTKSFAGHATSEAQKASAGEPGGLRDGVTQPRRAARRKSSFAGHSFVEAQTLAAGEPGGQPYPDAQASSAARRTPSSDGHGAHEAQNWDAVDAPGQVRADAQQSAAGGDPIAGHSALEAQTLDAGNGADLGQSHTETHTKAAEVRATISAIIEIGRQNSFAIRQRMRVKQATLSHIARAHFGYHTGLTETERKKVMDAATKLIKAIAAGEDHPAATLVHATSAAAAPWEAIERDTEKALVKLARKLPAHAWAKDVRGFGDLSFARIIAETGDLTGYDNPAKVWKRLGLAVFDGKAQRRTRDAEKAVEQGYSPRRRSVVFVAFDPVIRAQSVSKSSGGHDRHAAPAEAVAGEAVGAGQREIEAHFSAAGPYRQIYDRKKADYLARVEASEEGWTKLRADRAAKRYASKRLLRDLWVAWRHDVAGQISAEAHNAPAGDSEPEAAIAAVKPRNRVPPRARKRK